MTQHRSAAFKRALASNPITRGLLKLIDRRCYDELKGQIKRREQQKRLFNYCPPGLDRPPVAGSAPVTCKHSGNAGDVIYSLPAGRILGGTRGVSLKLALDVPLQDRMISAGHPLGGVQLNRKMYDMLAPLLGAQEYIKELGAHEGGPVDYDLDSFRDSPLQLDRIGISRWYFHMFGLAGDLAQPWLKVVPDETFAGTIIVSRSFRYRNVSLDYGVLKSYGAVAFVGLPEEFEDMRRQLPSIRRVEVNDFLELARVIAGSRLFIGNQSFPFSLAEGLKVRRILEADPGSPNVVPTGAHAYDVLFQRQFEHVLAKLLA